MGMIVKLILIRIHSSSQEYAHPSDVALANESRVIYWIAVVFVEKGVAIAIQLQSKL